MEQKSQTDEVVEEIESVDEEYSTRLDREKSRHESKMSDIKEARETHMQDLQEQAGLDELAEQWEEIKETRDEVVDLEKSLSRFVKKSLNELHSGGFQEKITVKNGGVHKYGKKKRSSISAERLVSTYKRGTVDELIDHHLSGVEATQFKLAFDRIKEVEQFSSKGWGETTEVDIGNDDVPMELKVYFKKTKYSRHGTEYIRNSQNRYSSSDNIVPTTTNAEKMKFLIQHKNEVTELVDAVEERVNALRDTYEETLEAAQNDIPVDVDL